MNHKKERKKMVKTQIKARGITANKVLQAMETVPRHKFVPPELKSRAYNDTALPIGEGQTISQPYIVALMIQELDPKEEMKVLEIGTGSGYAAAVLSRIVDEVYTIEVHSSLAKQAKKRYQELGYDNIQVEIKDGSKGWQEKAPFDGILVSAGAPAIPEALTDQLTIDGRLVIPVGEQKNTQKLFCLTRKDEKDVEVKDLGYVRFVPLVGENGW